LDLLKTEDELSGLSDLERFTGYFFKSRERILEALTHASFANENSLPYCNERLEFLGDAVLQLCVSSLLFRWFPEDDEGVLSCRRAALVCGDSLSDWAVDSGIPSLLRLGRGFRCSFP
jgi:ribonuclease-3